MATRTFADLSPYRRAVSNAQAGSNLLDSLIQGVQSGIQLQQLPQQLQDQALARQLANAINTQKLNDIQNPDQALARRLQEFSIEKAIQNPELGVQQAPAGLVGETISTPQAVNQTALTLDAALRANPSIAIPSAAPTLPITPIGIGNIQTGLNVDQNIPAQARQSALEREIEKVRQTAILKNQLESQQPQVFSPGSTVGTFDEIRRGQGVKIPDKASEPKPFSLSPGEKLFAPDGSLLAENPGNATSQRPISVSPGGVVIDASGKEIFRNPAATPGTSGKPLPKSISERVSDAQSAIDNLITLKSYIDSPDVKSISGPVSGRTFGANPFSTTAQNFEGIRATAKQVIGKYLEGGVLREADEKKYEKIVPGLKMLEDTQQNQAAELYNTLKKKLVRDLDSYEKSGYDVSGLREAVNSLDAEFKSATQNSNIPTVTTQEEFNSLPSGATYLEDGEQYTKP